MSNPAEPSEDFELKFKFTADAQDPGDTIDRYQWKYGNMVTSEEFYTNSHNYAIMS